WVRRLVGDDELNFRFSILQRRVGFRHFANGCTCFKQVTGNEQRDIARYLIVVLNGLPSHHKTVITALRFLMEFVHLGEYGSHDDDTLQYMSDAVAGFHKFKQAILDAELRMGSNGPMDNMNIPKAEMFHFVVESIKQMGIPAQHSTDITENKLIEVAKKPFRMTNHRDAPPQMVRALDRASKHRIFSLYLE
ncbi:hypothetical protein BD410DRAFT_684295, partial [Rickenella mellea]